MIDIANKLYKPTLAEISMFVGNPLFDQFLQDMERTYQPRCSMEYSGDKVLLGWNVKVKKAGKTLCTVYPRQGYFPMLLVIGRKEKEQTEALLPSLSAAFQEVYRATQEGMGQRWLLFEFHEYTSLYDDVCQIIRLRRECR